MCIPAEWGGMAARSAPCVVDDVRRARLLALLLAGAVVGSAAALFTLRRQRPPILSSARAVHPAEPALPTEPPADWCAPGYEPIAGGCLALSATAQDPQPVLVYLHGRYARDAAAEEVDRQRRLGTAATTHGFAVLALRGRLGECTAAELAQWFCWPSNEHNEEGAAAVVATWAEPLREAHRRSRSKTRFVLGFSNGAYFAGLLATQGLLDAEAFVIAHGGPVEPVQVLPRMPPLLLLSADDDIAQDDMIRLDGALTRERWPHDSYARAGAHGLTDGDMEAALSFFTRAHEALPLEPPLPLHRPAHHAHEAVAARPAEETLGAQQP
jgi:predicted esterase